MSKISKYSKKHSNDTSSSSVQVNQMRMFFSRYISSIEYKVSPESFITLTYKFASSDMLSKLVITFKEYVKENSIENILSMAYNMSIVTEITTLLKGLILQNKELDLYGSWLKNETKKEISSICASITERTPMFSQFEIHELI